MNPIRLSYSSLELLNGCERKFQLIKLLAGAEQEESEHLSFGHAFGAGIASYAANQDADQALYKAWLAYWPQIESQKKFQTQCFALLQRTFPVIDSLLQDYDVVFYKDKVAAELSFRINLDEESYFVGHIDLVLQHRFSKIFTVLEVKTTGLNITDLSPQYANSSQAVGYSVALDQITGQKPDRFEVLYLVGQIGKNPFDANIKVLPFRKSIIDRLHWFISLGLDLEKLNRMKALNTFPRRGSSCLAYNRPCKFFQTCTLSSLDTPKAWEPDLINYDFTFEINELVDDHLERVEVFRANNDIASEEKLLLQNRSQGEAGEIEELSGELDGLLDLKL